jgi:TAT-translocated FGD2 family F420-dependent dehydrogenase
MARVGFVLSQEQFPVTDLLEFGAAAERAGFDALWTSDHFHPWMDNQGHAGHAWVTLAALGQLVPRVVFGTGVTCPTYRYNPTIVAQAFATLGLLYPGRVFLGVGSGQALNEVPAGGGWGDYDERSDRLIEAITVIRELWTGEWVTYDGPHYYVNRARLYDVPEQPVPIYIAAGGTKSMHLAGQYGDGLITDARAALERDQRAAFEEGAHASGKDPAAMPILVEHFVVVGGKQEAAETVQLWRFIPKAWDEFVQNPDPRDIQRRAEQQVPDQEVIQRWLVSDDPDEHADSLRKLVDAGVAEVYIHAGQHDQRRVIDFYGRQVLPRLRKQRERTA